VHNESVKYGYARVSPGGKSESVDPPVGSPLALVALCGATRDWRVTQEILVHAQDASADDIALLERLYFFRPLGVGTEERHKGPTHIHPLRMMYVYVSVGVLTAQYVSPTHVSVCVGKTEAGRCTRVQRVWSDTKGDTHATG